MNWDNLDWNLIVWTIGMIILAVIITKALNKVTPSNEPKEDIKP